MFTRLTVHLFTVAFVFLMAWSPLLLAGYLAGHGVSLGGVA